MIQDYLFYQQLIKLPFVQEIRLFGSRARGDHQERSDIDLAVFCPQATQQDWIMVLDIIDDADTLLKIDCIRLDELQDTSQLKKSILTQGVTLYERV